ncbi:MAG: hypothetical protein E7628_00330 [Ruminococcaceae bacterium]|nr:hypothetical protein [Oscillospiraceae bacterium]
MKARFISRKLLLYSALVLCGVVGLLVFAYSVIHGDTMLRESIRDYYKAEMYASANCFIVDVEQGEMTLAYHHAKYAADHASMGGLSDAAEMFDSISVRVLSGEMTADMAQQVKHYIETGTVNAVNVAKTNNIRPDLAADVPVAVSIERYKAAKNTTDKILGGKNIIRRMERTCNGELLFSCANAYALIDERTALPIEAGISLDAGEITMSADECIAAAERFLLMFYSEDTVKNGSVTNVMADGEDGVVNIDYMLGTRKVTLSVKGDSGRVVSFSGR